MASSWLYLKPQGTGCPSAFTFWGCLGIWVFVRERAHIKMPECFYNHASIRSSPCSSHPSVPLTYEKKKICILIVNIFAMWDLQILLHSRPCTFQGESGLMQLEAPWGEVLPCSLLTAGHLHLGGRGLLGALRPPSFLEYEPISPVRTICALQSSLARGKSAPSNHLVSFILAVCTQGSLST